MDEKTPIVDQEVVVVDENPEILPQLPDVDFDWDVIIELIPDSVQKILLAIGTAVGLATAGTGTVFGVLYSRELVAQHTAFVALTVCSIILGLVGALVGALAAHRRKETDFVEVPALDVATFINDELERREEEASSV